MEEAPAQMKLQPLKVLWMAFVGTVAIYIVIAYLLGWEREPASDLSFMLPIASVAAAVVTSFAFLGGSCLRKWNINRTALYDGRWPNQLAFWACCWSSLALQRIPLWLSLCGHFSRSFAYVRPPKIICNICVYATVRSNLRNAAAGCARPTIPIPNP